MKESTTLICQLLTRRETSLLHIISLALITYISLRLDPLMALFLLILAFLAFSFGVALFMGLLLRRRRESEEIEQWYIAVLLDAYEESKTGKSTYQHRQHWEQTYSDTLISADIPHQREIIRVSPPYGVSSL